MAKLKGSCVSEPGHSFSACFPEAHRRRPEPLPNTWAALGKRQLNIFELFFQELFDPYMLFNPGLVYLNSGEKTIKRKFRKC